MYATALLTKSPYPSTNKIAACDMAGLTADLLKKATTQVQTAYAKLGSSDQVAKGTELLAALQAELKFLLAN
jgi:hypothetical protein